jgi:O-antigen ligase
MPAADDIYTQPNSRVYRAPLVVGVLLLVLLIFSSSTVFIREAWPLEFFQIGVYALLGTYLLVGLRRTKEKLATGITPWFVYLIPVWGIAQIVAHTTVSSLETREAVLRWGALAGVFFLCQVVGASQLTRRVFLSALVVFATCMAVLCVTQLFSSKGLVLWIFPTGYPDVYGTFQNQNNYAQFVELAFPVALWRALHEGWRSWWYGLSSGVLYASVIASASRAGAILCTAELLVLLAIGVIRLRNAKTGRLSCSTALVFIFVPLMAVAFTLAVGWQRMLLRMESHDPFSGRREFLIAAIDMVKHRPLTGSGLGTFPEVYQQYAVRDFPFYANHAHNDWAEFAADGGLPFLLIVVIPFVGAIPTSIRHPWGLGLIAVMLHACVDYPFPRPAVSGWIFALLAMLYMTRASDSDALIQTKDVVECESSESYGAEKSRRGGTALDPSEGTRSVVR